MTQSATGDGKRRAPPNRYEIHIKESIDPRWVGWFEGMTIHLAENGETVLSGPILDKAALHGMLALIGELNLTLVSVVKLKPPIPLNGGMHEK